MKEENDLSDKGIVTGPKPYKNTAAETAEIESLKLEIDNSINNNTAKIAEIEKLYSDRIKKNKLEGDPVKAEYLKRIEKLKSDVIQAKNIKQNLVVTLEEIKIATAFEKSRRIKQAVYDSGDDRHKKDRATLERIRQYTQPSNKIFSQDDFDFGEEHSNIQIVKNIKRAEEGYYLVLAIHDNESKRDEFLKQAVAAGQKNIDFFFDVKTSKYYIYNQKYNNITQAQSFLDANKGKQPYNAKLSMVKIEN